MTISQVAAGRARIEVHGDLAAAFAKAMEGVDVEAANECVDRFDEMTEQEKDTSMRDAPLVVHRMNVRAVLKAKESRWSCSRRPVGMRRVSRPRERRNQARGARACRGGTAATPSPGDETPHPLM